MSKKPSHKICECSFTLFNCGNLSVLKIVLYPYLNENKKNVHTETKNSTIAHFPSSLERS